MAEHTPTPWHHNGGKDGIALAVWNTDGGGDPIPHSEEIQICVQGDFDNRQAPIEVVSENMRFIVRACNAHDELLKSCEALLALANEWNPYWHDDTSGVMQAARNAITLAKGNP